MPRPDKVNSPGVWFVTFEARIAVPLVEGLLFANGLALDEAAGFLYLSETFRGVLRFRMNTEKGTVSDQTTVLEAVHPDNLELDTHNRLWVALPIASEIGVLDLATGEFEKVFSLRNPDKERMIDKIDTRIKEGVSWLELFGPPLWEPAPGTITGMILSPDDGTVFVSGLGDALIRLER